MLILQYYSLFIKSMINQPISNKIVCNSILGNYVSINMTVKNVSGKHTNLIKLFRLFDVLNVYSNILLLKTYFNLKSVLSQVRM